MSHISTTRSHWLAMLAKLTAPMESATAAQAFAAYLPMLSDFPDWVFSADSLQFVSRKCQPNTPSYGQLVEALGQWWRANRPHTNELSAPEPYKPRIWTPEEIATASQTVREVTAALRQQATEKQARYARDTPDWRRPAAEMSRAQLTEAYKRAGIQGPCLDA